MNTLTNEQKYVIDCLLEGNNVALLGGAGCGKSYLISTIYTEFPALKKLYMESQEMNLSKLPRIQLTALTGCASLLLGNKAKTLHSWAGIGLGKGTVQELFIKIRRNQKAMKNWLCTDLLVIDEISMMTGELLDKLNQLGRRIRPLKDKPFGGIQVLLVGDFYQLPPVNKNKDEPLKFTFESDTWKELFEVGTGLCIELQQIQRQKDAAFQQVLKESRIGNLSRESCAILRKCQERKWQDNLIRPTLLFPKRAEVDMINDSNLRALEGRRYTYDVKLVYDGKVPIGFDIQDEAFKKTLELFDTESRYLRRLELCKDAQVMLIANISPEEGLVNGSRGVIVDFCKSTDLPIVQFLNGIKMTIGSHTWAIEDYEFVLRSQIPLRLAYACTTHSAQGATLDSALVDIGSGVFEYGQAYVALSRARSLDALYVYDFEPTVFKAHPRVKEFHSKLKVVKMDDSKELLVDTLLELPIPEDAKIITGEVSEII
jgi:ATP-dependent DNA helicase PIF1